MTSLPKKCNHCKDPDGEDIFPYYGLPPHNHHYVNDKLVLGSTEFLEEKYYPFNFCPDEDGLGTYTCCIHCESPTIDSRIINLLRSPDDPAFIKDFLDWQESDENNKVVRLNLLNRKGYTPYCSSPICTLDQPRTIRKANQFVCGCGFRTNYDWKFNNAYRSKWNDYKIDEQVFYFENHDLRLYRIVSPVYIQDGIEMVAIQLADQTHPKDDGLGGKLEYYYQFIHQMDLNKTWHVKADELRYPTDEELITRLRSYPMIVNEFNWMHQFGYDISSEHTEEKPKPVDRNKTGKISKTTSMLMGRLK
jgi:hypothetical protein